MKEVSRIALVTDGIDPIVTGGMQKHSWSLAQAFAARGITVDLYHCYHGDLKPEDELPGFSPDTKKNISSILIPFPKHKRLPGHYLRESKAYAKQVYKEFLKRPQPDCVYIQGLAGWELLRAKSSTSKEITSLPPMLLNPHGLEMYQPATGFLDNLQKAMLRAAFDKNLQRADFVIALGGYLRRLLEEMGIASERILDLPNAVSNDWVVAQAQPSGQKLRMIFIGRYERRKGLSELNAALRNLSENHPGRFEMTIAGPIPAEARLNLSGISYTGLLKGADEVRAALDKADVLVLPSHAEGLPTVVLEAMARGLAVIATKVGAVPDLVSDENGWLITSRDINALEKAMAAAMNLPEHLLLQKKEASLQKLGDRFTWSAVTAKTLNYMHTIINP